MRHCRRHLASRTFALRPLALTLVLAFGAFAAICPARAAAQSPDRLVLAFYYNWFSEKDWSGGRVPDVPAEPYVSTDRGVMGRQIDQAKGAGIDALVVNWWGPRTDGNQTETNLRAMLDEAGARGFRLAVDVDMNSPFLRSAGEVQAAMAALLSTHANHPAYLRSEGKPVIFFYHQNARFGTGTWAAIRAAVDPGHGSIWIEEGVDVSPLTVFDGHHLYSVTWANRTPLTQTANKFARLVRNQASVLGQPKIYVATVMPGYDDTRNRGGGGFAVGREDGAYYERSWRAAVDCGADWVVINSFNEWLEGTHIEPSQACGSRYLEMTAGWAGVFRGASPAPPAAAAPVAPQPAAETVAAAPAVPAPTRPPAKPTPRPAPTATPTPKPPPEVPVRLGGDGPLAL